MSMDIFKATGQRLGSMTWARAVLVYREIVLESRINSPDKHEARKAMIEAERNAEAEEE
jgi:hypothetical protein